MTPEGLDVLERVLPDVRRIEEQMVSGMTGGQVVVLRDALQACRSALGGGLPH